MDKLDDWKSNNVRTLPPPTIATPHSASVAEAVVVSDIVGGNVVEGNFDVDVVVAAELDFFVRRGAVSSIPGVVGLISAATSPPPDFHTAKCQWLAHYCNLDLLSGARSADHLVTASTGVPLVNLTEIVSLRN